jgi:hypothetical protein
VHAIALTKTCCISQSIFVWKKGLIGSYNNILAQSGGRIKCYHYEQYVYYWWYLYFSHVYYVQYVSSAPFSGVALNGTSNILRLNRAEWFRALLYCSLYSRKSTTKHEGTVQECRGNFSPIEFCSRFTPLTPYSVVLSRETDYTDLYFLV